MRFANPEFFLLLFVIVPLWWKSKLGGGKLIYSDINLLLNDFTKGQFHPRRLLHFLRLISLVLLVCALARPQSGKKFTETSSEGVDIMLALDTSGSMQALDFKEKGKPVDRLHVVKKVVKEFVEKRPYDRIGFVVFGDDAFTQCPLTNDHGILMDFLDKVEIGMVGNATAIGQAVGVGVKRMKDLKAQSKVLILLTDGENTAGRIPPLKAAELAKTMKVKVYTIGVGTKGKAPFLQKTIFGKRYVYQEVNIDEKTLKSISDITGGKYFRAQNTEELKKIYEEIDRLEKTEIEIKEYTEYVELFTYYLLAALSLIFIELLLGNTLWRKLP